MKIVNVIFAFLVLTLSCTANARTPEPILNYSAIPVAATSGVVLTENQVCQIVREVAEQRKWLVGVQPDGKLVASLSWNASKHTIVVEVACSAASYSVLYKDSINMNFGTRDGQSIIHPHYNKFVRELNDLVRTRLMTL